MRWCEEDLRHNAENAHRNMQRTDKEVTDIIKQHRNKAERTQLLTLWKQETLAGEARSKQRSERSWQWMQDLPTEKPYYGLASYQPNPRGSRSNNVEHQGENRGANGAHGGSHHGQTMRGGGRYRQRQDGSGDRRGGTWSRRGRRDFPQGLR